jgi:hypothetical protein
MSLECGVCERDIRGIEDGDCNERRCPQLQSANAGKSQPTLDSREERRRKNKRLIFEREFFSLAGIYLACRWKAMGGSIRRESLAHRGDLGFQLLGMRDHAREMELLIEEVRG